MLGDVYKRQALRHILGGCNRQSRHTLFGDIVLNGERLKGGQGSNIAMDFVAFQQLLGFGAGLLRIGRGVG